MACCVGHGKAVTEGVVDERLLVGGAEHIATVAEFIVRDIHLSKQGGSEVGLVAELADNPRCLYYTAKPQHGNVVLQHGALVYVLVVDAVVGKHDDECLLPGFCFLQAVDEVADACVEIVEGIEHLVVEMADGHVPRLVA